MSVGSSMLPDQLMNANLEALGINKCALGKLQSGRP